MITNTGKDIVAKYLIGQAPAYASYIALGCGPKPLSPEDVLDTESYYNKTELDFEMFRVPITSRGYVTDIVDGNEISKVVFTAELPPEQRYEVSEIGVYSAKSNPSAASKDSRILYTFTESENWEYHEESSTTALGNTVSEPLDGGTGSGIIATHDPVVFRTTNDNSIFNTPERLTRYERCRFLNSNIMVPGDMSWIVTYGSGADEVLYVKEPDPAYHGNHIHLSGTSLDLGKNSPGDEIRLAFSVISKDSATTSPPTKVMILVEFASGDVATSEYAKFQVNLSASDLSDSRYHISKKKLSELVKSSGFAWSGVNLVKVYASAFVGSTPSSDYYIALDSIRFENVTTQNPVYGLTGYSPVVTDTGNAFVKGANTSNLIEFRFGLDVS